MIRVAVPLALAAALLTPAVLAAQTAPEAASLAARELMAGATKGNAKLTTVLVTPAPNDDAPAVQFWSSLTRALANEQGIAVVDREAVIAALNEAALGSTPPDSALADMAGAFGAQAIVTGTVERVGATYAAHLRLVLVGTGQVLASVKAAFSDSGATPSLEAQSLASQLRRLADRVAKGLDRLEGDLRYQRIAVLPFEEVGGTTRDKQLGLLVAAELMTALQRDHGVMLVERSQLAKVIDELALGQSGLVDPAQSTEVGRLAGAQALVLGSVSEAGDRYSVNARIVGALDGQVKAAEQVDLPAGDLVALSSEAVVLRSRAGAVYRSILLPGWGQLYNREPIKAGLFVGGEVAAAGLALTFHLLGDGYRSDYTKLGAGEQERMDRLVGQAEANYSRRNWLLITLAVIHGANILDALISGKSFDSALPGQTGAFGFAF